MGTRAGVAVLHPSSNSVRSRTTPPPVSRSTRPPWPPLTFPWLIRSCRPPEHRRRHEIQSPRIRPPAPSTPKFGRLHRTPPLVSTPSSPPRPPLSFPHPSRVPRGPRRQQFEPLDLPCASVQR
jgi:hypothetical protein